MFNKIGLPAKWCQECVSERRGVPLVMGKRPHVNRFQFLFRWLASFSSAHWLRESGFPGAGPVPATDAPGTISTKGLKCLKRLRVQILVFFPPHPHVLSPCLFFSFFKFLAGYRPCLIQPWREVAWLEARVCAPLLCWPQAAGGGLLGGGIRSRAGALSCQAPHLCRTSAALAKIIILSNNIFNSWPSPLYYPFPLEPKENVRMLYWKEILDLFSQGPQTWLIFPRLENWTPQCVQFSS